MLDLVGVQEDRWDGGATEPAGLGTGAIIMYLIMIHVFVTLRSWVRFLLKAWISVCVYSIYVLGSGLATS
jgi:hypothetical protein